MDPYKFKKRVMLFFCIFQEFMGFCFQVSWSLMQCEDKCFYDRSMENGTSKILVDVPIIVILTKTILRIK